MTTNRARLIAIWDRAGLAGVVLGSWVLFGVFADGFLSQFNIYSVGRLVSILVVVGLSQMVSRVRRTPDGSVAARARAAVWVRTSAVGFWEKVTTFWGASAWTRTMAGGSAVPHWELTIARSGSRRHFQAGWVYVALVV